MDALSPLISPNDPAMTLSFCLRTVVALVVGIICIRIAGRTTFSQLNALDIIVAVAAGSNLGRAMTGSPFIPSLGAVVALVALRRLLAAGTVRWSWLGVLTQGRPIEVIRDGAIDRAAQRRHRVSDAELDEAIRLGGAADASEVRLAVLEDGGRISIVRR